MNRKDVDQIIIATDAGREGELVARWIIEKANIRKPIKRLWISSVTDKAIKDGFNNLKDGRAYENLYHSAVARSEADWVVGINATRALTVKHNSQLSCGRVQTPTISMIAQREEEIRKFLPKEYYGIVANTKELKLSWQDSNTKDMRTFDIDKSNKTLEKLRGKDAKVTNIDKTLKKTYSPALYNLTELQRDANRIFGYSAKETLSIMQRLYENHKILTYPRTDSRYISDDVIGTLKDRVKACGIGPYQKVAAKILMSPIKGNKSFADNGKVTDHHAIIPTEERVALSNLNDNERKIYDLVVKRFLSILYLPFEYEQTTINAKIGDENFIAKGKRVISAGWKELYSSNYRDEDEEDDSDDQSLPLINKGDQLKVISLMQTKGKTKPPAPFNEGSLLQAMENPGKYMADESKTLIKIIGETGGIGTVATRADIIEKLFNTFLLEKNGKDIFITSKGKQLLELVPTDLKSPALTAEWEQKLGLISQGKLNKDTFIKEIKEYSKAVVNEIKNSAETFRHDNMTRNKCPECGKFMLEVKGKKGKMYVCQDRECGYRKSISRETNARCPNCKKKMEMKGEGDGQMFACSCGYREKLSVFNERRAKQKSNVSKSEVANYLKDQKKQKTEPLNTDLADALSKLKF